MRQRGMRLATIAEMYSTTEATIHNWTGRGYHAGFPARKPTNPGRDVRIVEQRAAGATFASIAATHNLSKQRIAQIVNKSHREH